MADYDLITIDSSNAVAMSRVIGQAVTATDVLCEAVAA